MNEYRVVWCDEGTVRMVDGLTLETANKAFAAVCRELRATLSWVHILRMPERTVYASLDRAAMDARDAMIRAQDGPEAPRWRWMNVGGELAPEDQA